MYDQESSTKTTNRSLAKSQKVRNIVKTMLKQIEKHRAFIRQAHKATASVVICYALFSCSLMGEGYWLPLKTYPLCQSILNMVLSDIQKPPYSRVDQHTRGWLFVGQLKPLSLTTITPIFSDFRTNKTGLKLYGCTMAHRVFSQKVIL